MVLFLFFHLQSSSTVTVSDFRCLKELMELEPVPGRLEGWIPVPSWLEGRIPVPGRLEERLPDWLEGRSPVPGRLVEADSNSGSGTMLGREKPASISTAAKS